MRQPASGPLDRGAHAGQVGRDRADQDLDPDRRGDRVQEAREHRDQRGLLRLGPQAERQRRGAADHRDTVRAEVEHAVAVQPAHGQRQRRWRRTRGEDGELPGGQAGQQPVRALDVGGDPRPSPGPGHGSTARTALPTARTVRITIIVRASRSRVLRRPPSMTARAAHEGMRTSSQNRQQQTMTSTRWPPSAGPTADRSASKNTLAAIVSASAWATCTPRQALIARHQNLASPSVCGSAWAASMIGAATTRNTTTSDRTTQVPASSSASTTSAPNSSATNGLAAASGASASVLTVAVTWAGSTPWPVSAAEAALARSMAVAASQKLRLAAARPTSSRGAISLTV